MTAAPGSEALAADETVRMVLSTGERPTRPSAVSASLTFAWRGLLKIKHVPDQLFDVTLTPVMFTLLFTYLFGGALTGSTSAYLQFLLPGILVITALFTTVHSGVILNTDVTKGVVDRFRSLPIWRSAPLVGFVLSDSLRYLIASGVVIVLGLTLGFRPQAGAAGVLAAVSLVVVFASGLAWLFATIGLLMRTPSAAMNLGVTLIFPLTFVSNIFVLPETMPSWLQAVVDVNPITHLVSATRGLMAGTVAASEIVVVLVTAVALTVVFAPVTRRLYRTLS